MWIVATILGSTDLEKMRMKHAVRVLISNKSQPVEVVSGDGVLIRINRLANIRIETELWDGQKRETGPFYNYQYSREYQNFHVV